jgi:hypothetical protein
MKTFLTLLSVAVAVSVSADVAQADPIWADDVAEYSGNIQNYGGTMMESSTEFWATGVPDADANGNGYVWDEGIDLDYVAGWRSNAPSEYLVVHFNTALADIAGDDLYIYVYGGSAASANVLASADGASYTQIGTLGGGTSGYLRSEAFDFGGSFSSGVQYVKVLRAANGAKTGMFFDAFGGTAAVPEPGTIMLLLTAAGFLAACRWNRA